MSDTHLNPAAKCPQCHTPLPTGALAGLCPACLLQLGAAADTVTDAKQPPFNPPTVAELAPLFPQLEILEIIGKGGMGAVYKARQKQLDRIVALKILPPGIGSDAAFAERFTREARALAKLNHPGIVTLYEFGSTSDHQPSTGSPQLFYFLMEFVDGVNLRQLLHAGRISAREALAIVPQICDALQFAHDQGIVHRDIKPENILMDRRGRVKVADFGLAKIVGHDGRADLPVSREEGAAQQHRPTSLTDAGKVMGTPNYMSPEQRDNPGEVDHRADIYALGVVFYQMLTGELPGKRLEPPSKKVQIDVRLDEIVLRALEKNPELRYQQVSEVKTCVETIAQTDNGSSQNPKSGVAPRFSHMAIAGACLAVALVSLILALVIREKELAIAPEAFRLIDGATANQIINSPVIQSWRHLIHVNRYVFVPLTVAGFFGALIFGGLAVWKRLRAKSDPSLLRAVEAWLALMDKGDYAQSWAAGSRSFRWAVTQGDWIEVLEKVRRPLGKILFRKLVSIKYSGLGTRFEAKFDSSFDGLKSTAETLVFTRQWNGAWKPAGYLIGHQARQSRWLWRLKKFFYLAVPAAILFTLIVRAYFLQPFHVLGGGVEPEIPVGSRILVWKFHPHIAPGDIIAHWHGNQVWASRVISVSEAGITINRNGQTDEVISSASVLGKVVSVYWRGTAHAKSGLAQGGTNAYPGDWIWEPDSKTMERVPPMFLLRPSTLAPTATPVDMMGKDRYLARGKTVQELITTVWSQKNSSLHLFYVASLPDDKFDFIVTGQPHWWNALKTEINRRFGLTQQIENHGGTEMVVVKKAGTSVLPSAFTAHFLQGQISLVAVGRFPSASPVWWQPDGTAIQRSFETGWNHATTNNSLAHLIFETKNFPDHSSFFYKVAPASCSMNGRSSEVRSGGRRLFFHDVMMVSVPKADATNALKEFTVQIGAASGAATVVATHGTEGGFNTDTSLPDGSRFHLMSGGPMEGKDFISLSYAHSPLEGWDAKITAVDNSGNIHEAASSGSSDDVLAQTGARFDGLKLSDIKEFRFGVRRFQWMEFRSIPLLPGAQSAFQIVKTKLK